MDEQAVRAKLQTSSPLAKAALSLHTDPKYSDLVIMCKGRKFSVHRAIICPQSEVFARMCDSSFKEAKEGVIHLDDDRLDVVTAMIEYLYTMDYADSQHSENGSPVHFNVAMHTAADKYDIALLAELAVVKFRKRADKDWRTTGFAHAVRDVYQMDLLNDHGLRESILSIAAKRGRALFSCASFCEVAETVPRFASALAARLAVGIGEERRYSCAKCSKMFSMQPATKGILYSCPYCAHKEDGKVWQEWC